MRSTYKRTKVDFVKLENRVQEIYSILYKSFQLKSIRICSVQSTSILSQCNVM